LCHILFKSKKLTANEVLDLILEADDALDDKNTGEYRVYLQPPMDQNGDTDCDDEEDEHEENANPVDPDVLPRRILLAPAEFGIKATKTPQIIGMRGIDNDVEDDGNPIREDDREEKNNEMECESFEASTALPQSSGARGARGASAATDRGGKTTRGRSGRARGGRTAKAPSQINSDDWSEQDDGMVGTKIPEFTFDETNPVWQHLLSINIDQPL
jgi:hypothetical protein